jgi:hypothetical protein
MTTNFYCTKSCIKMISVRTLKTSELPGLLYQFSMCIREREREIEFQYICEPE